MFLLLSLAIIIVCILTYYYNQRVSIALIYSVLWAFLSVFVWLLKLPKSEQAYTFILLNTILFCLPSFVVFAKVRTSSRCSPYFVDALNKKEERFLKINSYVVIINMIALLYLGYSLGFSFSIFKSAGNLMEKMNSVSSARYSDASEYLPIINRIVNSIVYATCGYCGFYIIKKVRVVYTFNLLLILIQTILTNTKATLVFGLAFWVAGLLTGYIFFKKKINLKKSLYVLLSIVGVVLVNSTINYLRHAGQISFNTEIERIVISYFIGPYSAFSLWFDSNQHLNFEMGANTFSSIFRILGLSPQTYGEFVLLNGVMTNVYTIFKHLVNDFSIFGTLIVSLIMGSISAFVDSKVVVRKYSYTGLSIVIIATILVAFFSSLFRQTTNVLACVIIILASLPIRFD